MKKPRTRSFAEYLQDFYPKLWEVLSRDERVLIVLAYFSYSEAKAAYCDVLSEETLSPTIE